MLFHFISYSSGPSFRGKRRKWGKKTWFSWVIAKQFSKCKHQLIVDFWFYSNFSTIVRWEIALMFPPLHFILIPQLSWYSCKALWGKLRLPTFSITFCYFELLLLLLLARLSFIFLMIRSNLNFPNLVCLPVTLISCY